MDKGCLVLRILIRQTDTENTVLCGNPPAPLRFAKEKLALGTDKMKLLSVTRQPKLRVIHSRISGLVTACNHQLFVKIMTPAPSKC